MYDQDSVAGRWLWSSFKLGVATSLLFAGAWWWTNLRGQGGPPVKNSTELVSLLRNHSKGPTARRVAAEALEHADPSVVPELLSELKNGDSVGREAAALALGRLEPKAATALGPLCDALNDVEPTVRRQAVLAVNHIDSQPERALAALQPLTHDADASVRDAVVVALRHQGTLGVAALMSLLSDPEPEIRRRAVVELGRVQQGPDDVRNVLRDCAKDNDPLIRAETYAALFRHSAATANDLLAAIHDVDPIVRATGFALLERLYPRDEPDGLLIGNHYIEDGVFAEAGSTVVQPTDSAPAEAVVELAKLLESDDEDIARNAAMALPTIRPVAQQARDALLAHLYDSRDGVRPFMFGALRSIGPESRLRPPDLLDAIAAAGEDVRSLIWDPDDRQNLDMQPDTPEAARRSFITDDDLTRLRGLHKLKLLCLPGNPVSDAELAQIAGFEELEWLDLRKTKITSAGLAHLSGLSQLRHLSLSSCEITDEGLKHIKSLSSLEELYLNGTRITDDGLRALAGLPRLKVLWLDNTQTTDAGLRHLSALKSLESVGHQTKQFTLRGLSQIAGLRLIRLYSGSVTDADLAAIEPLVQLRTLVLPRAAISDAGLAHIGKLTQLEFLYLSETPITDAGLIHLLGLTNLKTLMVMKTAVSPEGAHELMKSLSKVKVQCDRFSGFSAPADARKEVVGLREVLEGRRPP